jgi:outer membrane immunogenic protein
VAAATPSSPVTGWTGPYVGLGAGFRSSRTDVDNVTIANVPCRIPRGCTSGEPFNDTAGRISPYIGWNWQFAPQ